MTTILTRPANFPPGIPAKREFPNILFITGTDTGVGKTSVAALLVSALCSHGLSVGVLKPVETGCVRDAHGELVAADANLLWEAAGRTQAKDTVCIYRFPDPVAPSVAAAAAGTPIDNRLLLSEMSARSEKVDLLVVEGAGGLLVPLNDRFTFADLARESGAECLLVVGSRLGALNHAALTFEVLRSRKLKTLGYVLNELQRSHSSTGPVSAESTNCEALQMIAAQYQITDLGVIPFRPDHSSPALSKLSAAVIEHFALSAR